MPRRVWIERHDRVAWWRNILSLVLGQLPDEERREWLVIVDDGGGRTLEATVNSEAEAKRIRDELLEDGQ